MAEAKPERNKAILDAYFNWEKRKDIAIHHSISPARVEQIVNRELLRRGFTPPVANWTTREHHQHVDV